MADGPVLRDVRQIAGLSQEDLAARLGITGPAVSQTELRDYVRPDTGRKYIQAIIEEVRARAVAAGVKHVTDQLIASYGTGREG